MQIGAANGTRRHLDDGILKMFYLGIGNCLVANIFTKERSILILSNGG